VPLGKPLLETLDRMGYGGVVLDPAGQVLRINSAATRLLAENFPDVAGRESTSRDQALRALLRRSSATSSKSKMEEAWLVVQREAVGKRPLIVHVVPIETEAASGPHGVVILVDLAVIAKPSPESLQRIFFLTPAEAKLAIEIACGKSLDSVAECNRVTVATARKQLASVFAKTYTRRQAELVALLARVSILP
jgi:DNA-binding CsgD family transcriptional regulator